LRPYNKAGDRESQRGGLGEIDRLDLIGEANKMSRMDQDIIENEAKSSTASVDHYNGKKGCRARPQELRLEWPEVE
jgi:hypothetical protein